MKLETDYSKVWKYFAKQGIKTIEDTDVGNKFNDLIGGFINKSFIEVVIERFLKDELPIGTKFCFASILSKCGLSDEEQVKYANSFFYGPLNKLFLPLDEEYSGSPLNMPLVRLDLLEYFDQIDYDFCFKCGLPPFRCKISPQIFAVTSNVKGLIILNKNEEELKNLWTEFLQFVKTANRNIPVKFKSNVKGPIPSKGHWAKKMKYMFKKLPDFNETSLFFEKVIEGISND